MIERVFRDFLFQCGRVLSPVPSLQPQLALGAACRQFDRHVGIGTGSSDYQVRQKLNVHYLEYFQKPFACVELKLLEDWAFFLQPVSATHIIYNLTMLRKLCKHIFGASYCDVERGIC